MKIAVLGYSGSGKSTLARILGEKYTAEVLHLDTVQHLPGWEIRPMEEKQKIVLDFLNTHDAWVIDGNYKSLYQDRRLAEADRIILLLFNRFASLGRAYKRYRVYKGKSRPDMTVGCDEKLDAEFVRWILYGGRTKKYRDRYRNMQKQYPEKTIVLKNQKQLDAFIQSL